MIIRKIKEFDIDQCVDLGRELHHESEYSVLSFSRSKCASVIMEMIESQWMQIFVAELDAEIIGMVGCEMQVPYFSDDLVAGERLIYVSPGHRNGTAFARLINVFYQWALKKDAKIVYLRNTTGITRDQTEAIYKKLGFDRVGGIFRRDL